MYVDILSKEVRVLVGPLALARLAHYSNQGVTIKNIGVSTSFLCKPSPPCTIKYDCHVLTFLKAKTTRQRTVTMVEVSDVTVSGYSIWDGSSKTISTKKDA